MARNNRVIHSAVRVETAVNVNEGQFFPDGVTPLPAVMQSTSATYGPDQEDELAARLSSADGKRLIEAGALSGDWKFGGGAKDADFDADSGSDEALLLLAGIDKRATAGLWKAGFNTIEKINDASDEELKVSGFVTDAVIEKIRKRIKEHSDAAMENLQAPHNGE